MQLSFQLCVFNSGQNFLEDGPRSVALRNEGISIQKQGWTNRLRGSTGQLLSCEIVEAQISVARLTVHPMHVEVLFEPRQAQESFQRGFLHPRDVGKPHV